MEIIYIGYFQKYNSKVSDDTSMYTMVLKFMYHGIYCKITLPILVSESTFHEWAICR